MERRLATQRPRLQMGNSRSTSSARLGKVGCDGCSIGTLLGNDPWDVLRRVVKYWHDWKDVAAKLQSFAYGRTRFFFFLRTFLTAGCSAARITWQDVGCLSTGGPRMCMGDHWIPKFANIFAPLRALSKAAFWLPFGCLFRYANLTP